MTTFSATDEQFLELVQSCSHIVELQNQIKEKMSAGIFGITLSRNSGCGVSIFNCRDEIDASVTVSLPEESDAAYELWEKKPEVNPLLLFSALPPPALKKTQKHFSNVIKDIVELANIVKRIQKLYLKDQIDISSLNLSGKDSNDVDVVHSSEQLNETNNYVTEEKS